MVPTRSFSASKKLENLYQIKSHVIPEVTIKKPFSNLAENKEPIPNEGIGHPPSGFKATDFALTTTKRNDMNEIVFFIFYYFIFQILIQLENTHALSGYYSPFKPLSTALGTTPNENFSRKIKQIGEISYSPKFRTEEMRHLKV